MFDLNAANDKLAGSNKQYQQPGISENVIITELSLGESKSGFKYIQALTLGEKGELGRSPQMYLTDKAWPMTARNFADLIVATSNVTDDEAKEMVKAENEQLLLNKLSALLVGKKFRAKFKGDQSSTGTIFAQLGGSESMKVASADSKLYFNPTKDIKMYEGTLQNTTKAPAFSASAAGDNDLLPF